MIKTSDKCNLKSVWKLDKMDIVVLSMFFEEHMTLQTCIPNEVLICRISLLRSFCNLAMKIDSRRIFFFSIVTPGTIRSRS